MEFSILHQDAYYVAIHKPANILVHRSVLSKDNLFVLQELRNQLGRHVYPVHRLDRATSGVLVFGLSPAATEQLARQFREHRVKKSYWAIARGWVDPAGSIDHPVKTTADGSRKPAVTHYRRLASIELPYPVDRYPSARYSLVEAMPESGRRHQIRQHFKHISHHLIGDTTYGNGKHNRFFRERFASQRLLLLARSLQFHHPYTGRTMELATQLDGEWQRLLGELGWSSVCYNK